MAIPVFSQTQKFTAEQGVSMISTGLFSLSATNTPSSYSSDTLPTGLSLNTSTGAITGTPSVSGIFNLSCHATNGSGTGDGILKIFISPTGTPQVTSLLFDTATSTQVYTYQIAATHTPTAYSINGLTGGSVGADGLVTWTVPATQNTTTTIFRVAASNTTGAGASAQISLTISPSSGGGGGGYTQDAPEVYKTTDTGVDLYWTAFVPNDGGVAWPFALVLHPGGYKTGAAGPNSVSAQLASSGILAFSVEYRLSPPGKEMTTLGGHPAPAQNTVSPPDKGHYPEQTEDVKDAIMAARQDPRCMINPNTGMGLVYCVGGSAGASHSAFMAATGRGVSRPDLCVICSCGVSNLADLKVLNLPLIDHETYPVNAILNYAPNVTPADLLANNYSPYLSKLTEMSPVTYITARGGSDEMPPMMVVISSKDSQGIATSTGIMQNAWNKLTNLPIQPIEDGTTTGLIPLLKNAGYTESFAATPEAGTFKYLNVDVTEHAHAFEYWKTGDPGVTSSGTDATAIPWLLAGPPATTSQGPPPPPPPTTLLPYTLTVQPMTPGVIIPQIPGDATSCSVQGLLDNTRYTIGLAANNSFGMSDFTYGSIVTDPSSGVTPKPEPVGLFTLMDETPPYGSDKILNTSTQKFYSLDFMAGCRHYQTWLDLEADELIFKFDDDHWGNGGILAFLDFCQSEGKLVGFSPVAGIYTPQWVLDACGETLALTGGDSGNMPPPWNAIFQDKWLTMISALGAQIDNHPALAYIVIGGLGRTSETFLVKTTSDYSACLASANATGFNSSTPVCDAWADAGVKLFAGYKSAFPRTPVIVSLSNPCLVGPEDGFVNGITPLISKLNLPSNPKFGLMNAGLNSGSSRSFSIDAVIQDNSTVNPAGFQFGATTNADAVVFAATCTAGINLSATWLEPFKSDTNACDPSNPGYTPELVQAFNNALYGLRLNQS